MYVNFKQINKIKASSGSDIYGETVITSNYLDVKSESGADVKLEVNAGNVKCQVSSGFYKSAWTKQ